MTYVHYSVVKTKWTMTSVPCFYEGVKKQVNYDLWDQHDSASWPEKEGAGNLDVRSAHVYVQYLTHSFRR